MDYILYEQNGNVATITINREKALNALNSQVLDELNATLDAVDLATVRCLVITGAGAKSFVAGADIGEMSSLTKAEGEAFVQKDGQRLQRHLPQQRQLQQMKMLQIHRSKMHTLHYMQLKKLL